MAPREEAGDAATVVRHLARARRERNRGPVHAAIRAIAAMTATVALLTATLPASAGEPFSFVVLGDMPYAVDRDYGKFERLLAAIDAAEPGFTVHVGDVKAGADPCTDERIDRVHRSLDAMKGALVFTPGDNEWTDCHRAGMDPVERLDHLRQTFFPRSESLGRRPIPLTRQADVDQGPGRSLYVENARWTHQGVVFVTAHVVGSNNNFEPRSDRASSEFFARDAASSDWIRQGVDHALATNAPALVVIFHADPLEGGDGTGWRRWQSGFTKTILAIRDAARRFERPILVVHGDFHHFVVDQPFLNDDDLPYWQVTRLQTFGNPYIRAVRVTVDPSTWSIFGFSPLDFVGRD
jgi:hypothetical protein